MTRLSDLIQFTFMNRFNDTKMNKNQFLFQMNLNHHINDFILTFIDVSEIKVVISILDFSKNLYYINIMY